MCAAGLWCVVSLFTVVFTGMRTGETQRQGEERKKEKGDFAWTGWDCMQEATCAHAGSRKKKIRAVGHSRKI